jgi:hypothetical protein
VQLIQILSKLEFVINNDSDKNLIFFNTFLMDFITFTVSS